MTICTDWPYMTVVDEVVQILEDNPAVHDYSVSSNDRIRFWVGTPAHREAKQAVVTDLEGLEGVEVELEKQENDWLWYDISVTNE